MDHRRAHTGAKQPHIFSHKRADVLDDDEREEWLPTDVLIALLALRDGENACDFGAGTGRYALAFARAYPNARIAAYDIQPEFVTLIESRVRDEQLENIRATPQVDDRFDRIFAANVLHEIGDDDLVVMRNALSERGHALILDWDADIDRPTGPPREHAHTRAEAIERLQRAGFTHIKLIEEPKLPYHFVFDVS
jgi:ubiquinone/menaquinone biosynthesis C-methylase UbiE